MCDESSFCFCFYFCSSRYPCGVRTVYPSGAPEFTPGCSAVIAARSVFYLQFSVQCYVDHIVSPFSFDHCIACSYGF